MLPDPCHHQLSNVYHHLPLYPCRQDIRVEYYPKPQRFQTRKPRIHKTLTLGLLGLSFQRIRIMPLGSRCRITSMELSWFPDPVASMPKIVTWEYAISVAGPVLES